MKKITDFEFVSVLRDIKNDKLYYGIIQNISKSMISFYDLKLIADNHQLPEFMALAKTWWNITPCIPLCIFYREKLDKFNYAKIPALTRDIKLIAGCKGIRLRALSERRIKRRLITIG